MRVGVSGSVRTALQSVFVRFAGACVAAGAAAACMHYRV